MSELMQEHNRRLFYYKREILSKICTVIFMLVIPMSFFRFYEENYLQGVSDLILGVFLFYTARKAKVSEPQYFYPLARKVFFLAFVTLFILMAHTHETITLFIWFTTAIYLIFYLFDDQEGWRWFITIGVIISLLFLYDPKILGLSLYELLVLFFNMIAVLYIITWYERIKSETAQSLLVHQQHLEARVEEKTQALKELNANLEKRVQEEIAINRLKEQQLIQQSRLAQMGEIISMIAHQWRQPLAAISTTSMFLELKAKHNSAPPELVSRKVKEISELSQYLSRTIDDFRDFFKPNRSKVSTSYEEIIASVVNMIGPSLISKGISFKIDQQSQERFFTYSNKVKQVLLNLIKNAEDVLTERQVVSPKITIRTYEDEDVSVLEVLDNAGGIDTDVMEKIFDPYFSTKSERNGTGLGLYMSKVIVEKHCGGILSVENTQEGAVFRIVLYRDGDASSEL